MLESINRTQWKLFGGIGAVVIIVLVLFFSFGKDPPQGGGRELSLTVWGVDIASDEIQPVLDDFKAAYERTYRSKLELRYQSWTPEEYEDVLVNKIAEGKGPDVAFIKNTWLLKHYTKLIPLPESFTGFVPRGSAADIGVWTPESYESVFMKTAAKDFIASGKIYAVPLFVDSLALYFNEDLYRQAGAANSRPGATWDAIAAQAPQLMLRTFTTGTGIRRAAVALGTVRDIRVRAQRADVSLPTLADNGSELVSLFLLQHGGSYCRENCEAASFGAEALRALEAYLSYANPSAPNYSWSPGFVAELKQQYVDDDVDAFLSGNVAAVLGYSDLYREIAGRSTGRNFNLKVAAAPQLAGDDGEIDRRVSLASYWGVAVTKSANTKFKAGSADPAAAAAASAANQAQAQAALELVKYLGQQGPQLKLFRATKRPPAREDLIETAAKEAPEIAPIIRQAQVAESLVIYDETALKEAIAAAFEATPASAPGAAGAIQRQVLEALDRMTKNPGRTPVPPKPARPPGTR